MNKKVILLWIITVICLILTVVFWFLSKNTNVKYEKVKATVINSSSKVVTNKNTKSKVTFYAVTVKYSGKEYDLKNVHSLSGYSKGSLVDAYLSNGKLYANVEGVTSSTPISMIYFAFLISTLILFIGTPMYMAKVKNNV